MIILKLLLKEITIWRNHLRELILARMDIKLAKSAIVLDVKAIILVNSINNP